jgi:hypothetical protein
MRRSAVIKKANGMSTEPASLPEVLIPPSEAAANERSAYWLQLIDNPDQFKSALASEDFFPLLSNFPEAFWGDNRLSLYLYRREDDEGRMIKNVEGKKKYIAVFHQPIDEEAISRKCGGGKYTLYLKLDSKETLREYTFWLDGIPKVLPGQVVEIEGKPVSMGGTQQPQTAEDNGNAVSKVIDASAKANESAMGILADAAKNSIAMVREQAVRESAPQKDPIDQMKTIMEIMRLQQPAQTADPMTTALTLMDKLESIIARRNPATETDARETPLDEAIGMVEKVTGKPLADIMKGSKAVTDATPSWVGPALSVFGNFVEKLPTLMHQASENRRQEFERQVYLASRANGQNPAPPGTPRLPAPSAPPPAPTPINAAPANGNAEVDPAQLMNAIVRHICAGFEKPPVGEWGEATAAAMDFHFSNPIEAMGISDTLADPEKVKEFVAGVPELASRSKDPRWPLFEEEFLAYCADRWGVPEEEKQSKPGPQPVGA